MELRGTKVTPEQERILVKLDQREAVPVSRVLGEVQQDQLADPVLILHIGMGRQTGMTRILEDNFPQDLVQVYISLVVRLQMVLVSSL